jgi:hypothetical protein
MERPRPVRKITRWQGLKSPCAWHITTVWTHRASARSIPFLHEEAIINLIRRTGSPLARYRPSAIEDQFGRMLESMFEDFFTPATQAAGLSRWPDDGIASPRLEVTENEKSFQVQADIPGVKKEDAKVAIDRQRVTIEAQSRSEEA